MSSHACSAGGSAEHLPQVFLSRQCVGRALGQPLGGIACEPGQHSSACKMPWHTTSPAPTACDEPISLTLQQGVGGGGF